MTPVDIVVTAHWDMETCHCWVCNAGRAAGCAPRERRLDHRNGNREKYSVPTDWVQGGEDEQ